MFIEEEFDIVVPLIADMPPAAKSRCHDQGLEKTEK